MPQTHTITCPSLAEIEQLVASPVPDPPFAAHMDQCAACRAQADAVRQNNQLMDRLRHSTDQSAFFALSSSTSEASFDAPVALVAGYEILREVHRGGQGVVYLARQLATRRTVALKLLLAGSFATSRQRRRFEREVDLIASLRHPNIVTVFDSGTTPDGRLWLAMEYVEGQSLEVHADRSRDAADPRAARNSLLALFATICSAVHYAHQRGIIHRDLKPANILIDGAAQPHVLDFGLAKPINPQVVGDLPTLTVAGGFMGTLAYASPEQTRRDELDAAAATTDVYSLGVILHQMLAGSYPYSVQGPLSDVLDAIATTPPAPLRSIASTRYPVDHELETIVLKALAKEPLRRYQSADDLRRDIDHYLAGEPIDARRDSRWYVLTKTMSRHKVPVSVAAAFVLLLLGFGIAMSILYQRASAEAEKVAAINVFLEDTLGSVEPGPRGEVTVRQMLDEGVHWIDLVLDGQPDVEAAVRGIVGNGYRNLGHHEQAERQLVEALEIRRRLYGEDSLQAAKGLSALGWLRRDQGRLDQAVTLFEQGLAIRERRLGHEHLDTAMSLANLAAALREAGQLDRAQRLFRQALAIRVDQLGTAHADVAMSQYSLALLLEDQGALEEALELHQAALAVRRSILHPSHPDLRRSIEAIDKLQARRTEAAAQR
ncbi:MAG: serine/threonine-protein kinase [Phycisphaerales bacterium]|nr:serine/threonine-protein kinase [Phycisphaerales bacterium]MCI0674365.1 serine/threonine-protein kinase [Phycisphaerales bacterium]